MTYKGSKTTTASSAEQWREWLIKNHETAENVWLVICKKDSGVESVTYNEAVDDTLFWLGRQPAQ